MENSSVLIKTDKIMRRDFSEFIAFTIQPPFFLLVKFGSLILVADKEYNIAASTITVVSKDLEFILSHISKDCECILLQYNQQYVRNMSFQLNFLDAYKYIYINSRYTFILPEKDLNDLWYLAFYIDTQLKQVHKVDLGKHILRHLNYSFLYSAIDKMDRNNDFQSNPTNQKEKLVLRFFENLQNNATSKLNVADYANKQHITARNLSTMVKEITGMTALNLIHRSLLRRSKTLLTTTDKPISEIALDLGYTDPYSFSHFFKK